MREFCPLSSSDNAGSPPSVSVSKLRSSEAGRWPGTILDLADQFGLDLDQLKQHQVCELYSAGFDKLAEEVHTGFYLDLVCKFLEWCQFAV
ncbi:hypothetical protein DPMN_090675 [Dreissena polymorpha]|uniref:Rab3GAP regulatory subunit C-terminal domain-containing protein n=1 Tax=Dreissena polymorpha TaxID=45954 RepID=A0A9D4KY63_DREPO|nr:hypothetical protein DPMN_090675 [Dreissena polymorpha]